jgi:hypothetical protein
MTTLAPLLCAALAAAPAPSKPAESVGVLALAPPPGPSPELGGIAEKLRDELAKRMPGVLDASELKERMAGQTPNATLPELDRAYAAAVEASKTNYERSIEWLRDIIAELERQPESQEAFDQWTRANLRLARTRIEHATSPQEAERAVSETRAVLERMVRAAPDLVVDPDVYPRKLVTMADDAKAQLRKAPARKVVVRSSADATQVFVSGRAVGTAPVTLRLAKGSYRITGRQGALRAPPVLLEVGDDDPTIVLDFSLASVYRPGRGPGLAVPEQEQDEKVVRAASALGVDRVVTAALKDVQGATFLVASFTQVKPHATPLRQGWMRLVGNVVPVGGFAALAQYLVSGQSSDIVAERPIDKGVVGPMPALSSTTRAEVGNSPAMKWTPVVTGVLAVGLGAFAVIQASSANKSYDSARAMLNSTGQLPPSADRTQYNRYLSDGDSARSKAYIGAIGAGAALVTTGVVGYIGYRQTGEFGPIRF